MRLHSSFPLPYARKPILIKKRAQERQKRREARKRFGDSTEARGAAIWLICALTDLTPSDVVREYLPPMSLRPLSKRPSGSNPKRLSGPRHDRLKR